MISLRHLHPSERIFFGFLLFATFTLTLTFCA
jgi:hypothetical protein